MKKRFLTTMLAIVLSVSTVAAAVPATVRAANQESYEALAAESNTALEAVRQYARESFRNGENQEAMALDLDLKGHTFDGTENGVITYAEDSPQMQVLKNLSKAGKGGTIIYRFKSTSDGVLFGAGEAARDDGRNMILGLQTRGGGDLRIFFRNKKNNGLKGYFAPGLKDGSWHTAALVMRPGETENAYLVVDGGENIYPSVWWSGWRPGICEHDSAFKDFQIGGGNFSSYEEMGNFNGSIDFITVTDQEFTIQELKELTAPEETPYDNNFNQMTSAGSKNTWLFTGSDTTVTDFEQLGPVRNYVGFFEDNLRSGGTFVERSRYVYNTAQPGLMVSEINNKYAELIAAYNPKAVGIMVDRSDYQKGDAGLDAFKTSLRALMEKLYADKRLPFIITPTASQNADETERIASYIAAINEVAEERGTRVADITEVTEGYLDAGNRLTALGHQETANKIKAVTGVTGKNTNYGGFYLGAEPTSIKADAAPEVTAGADSITVKVPEEYAQNTWTCALAYDGQTREYPDLASEFTIENLEPGKQYILSMVSDERAETIIELEKVEITVSEGGKGVAKQHPDGNEKVISEIQSLLTREEPVEYLFMGDSITHGIGTSGYDNVPQLFEKYLREQGRMKDVVINSGVSNATLSTTLNQIDHRLNQYDPDVVFVMLGTNDSSVNGERAEGGKGFTVQEYKDYYKELARNVYQKNQDSYMILRVPCDMTVDAAHSKYKEFFASIYDVEKEMKAEIPEMKIAVIDHMQDWIDYSEHVRNDFMSTASANTWMVDSVHPNGRGNMRMFQQILKETGLYRNDSRISNYQFKFGSWTENSKIAADTVCDAFTAELSMSQLSAYTNGLTEVTLKLQSKKGESITKTAEYQSFGKVSLNIPSDFKIYMAQVTGKDAVTNKEIQFSARINGKETGTIYNQVDQSTLTGAAESYNSANEGADKALDGDISTIWHSNYSNDAQKPVMNPATGEYERNGFTINLGETRTIGKLEYQPRSNGNNGNIRGYQLYYSTTENGDDFLPVPGGSGEWVGDGILKSAEFEPLAMRRIQLRALSTVGNTANTFISAAEFRVFTVAEVEPDIPVPDCACRIESLVFDGKSIELKADEDSAVFALNASATLSGDCKVHKGKTISYKYSIADDPAGIGSITDDKLTMTKQGTVLVKVTVQANGKTAEKTAEFSVTKKEQSKTFTLTFDANGGSVGTPSITCTRGQVYGSLPIPVREGFAFFGWFTEAEGGAEIRTGNICNMESDGTAYARWTKSTVVPDPPVVKLGVPGNPGASSNKEKSIKISWAKAENAQGYILSRYDTKTRKWKDIKTLIQNQFTDKGLKPATKYQYRVRAFHKIGSKVEERAGVQTLATATRPKKPELKLKKAGNKKVKLTWNKKTKADGYVLYVKAGKESFKKIDFKKKKVSYTKSKLVKGMKYVFKLRGYKKVDGKYIYSQYSKTVKYKA